MNEPKNNTLTSDNDPSMLTFELFPDFEDDDLVKVLTQIEEEYEVNANVDNQQKQNQALVPKEKSSKTINYSATNISNVNHTPVLPHMYFPHSNVTINYNISK